MAPVAPRSGDAIFANIEHVNAELFTLTYGAIVRQLLTDLEEVDEVNKQLDQMYIYELCSTDTSDQGMVGVWHVLMSGIDTDTWVITLESV